MPEAASRSFIAAMQVTLDGYSVDPEGNADWVDSWADALQLLPRIDAFVLGGGMFPEYEGFWAAVQDDPAAVSEWLGREPYPRETSYAQVAAATLHLVLSTTLTAVTWPTARIVRSAEELRAFKAQPGEAVYVVGGAGLVTSLINEALIDELRLIVHPVAVGEGTPLFEGIARRQALELVSSEPAARGRLNLTYRVVSSSARATVTSPTA